MVAVVAAVTVLVVIVNVAVVAFAATVTDAGTEADTLLLDSVTTAPPAGAAAVSVTVPVLLVPPVTLVGLTETADSFAGAGLIVSVAVLLTPLYVAVMVAVVVVATAAVVMVNVAGVCPAATSTVVGTIAAAALLLKLTVTPPVPAALDNVTVPVEFVPPVTVAGFTETEASVPAAGLPTSR
jgi:hypothetical protein